MAVLLVQQETDGTGSATSAGATLVAPAAVGNLVVLTLTGNNQHATGVTGLGAMWFLAKASAKTSYIADVWFGVVLEPVFSAQVTATFAGLTSAGCNVSEWSGLGRSVVSDPGALTAAGTSVSPSPGTMVAGLPGPVLYLSCMARAAAVAVSAGPTNGFTALSVSGGGGVVPNVGAYRIDQSPLPATPGWTLASSVVWEDTVVAFRGGSSGPQLMELDPMMQVGD